MDNITIDDLKLISELTSKTYTNNSILTNATKEEKEHLKKIKLKLKFIATYFNTKYNLDYGPFVTSIVTGNDIAIGGTKLKRIWSGIFKGNTNKQYSTQISFVANHKEQCLDVGFYFGRAHSHNIKKEDKIRLEEELFKLARNVNLKITNDTLFNENFFKLSNLGFTAYSHNQRVSFEDWVGLITSYPSTSQVIVKVFPNEIGIIDLSNLDFFVSQIIFMMSAADSNTFQTIKPLTIEQRAKQLQRLCEIGLKGEKYIYDLEVNKLKSTSLHPDHVSLKSDGYGYDILSYDENGNEIFIEVKTTCRMSNDKYSSTFYISKHEYKTYVKNKKKYKLYRVYDIENSPSFKILNLDELTLEADGYCCKI